MEICPVCKKKLKWYEGFKPSWTKSRFCSINCYNKSNSKGNSKHSEINILKEIRCTCKSCGKIWYYTNKDIAHEGLKSFNNFSKDFYQSCDCCILGAMMPRDKIRDLKRCPSCESKNVSFEEVAHKVKNAKTSN